MSKGKNWRKEFGARGSLRYVRWGELREGGLTVRGGGLQQATHGSISEN